jgi:hypothetical protein
MKRGEPAASAGRAARPRKPLMISDQSELGGWEMQEICRMCRRVYGRAPERDREMDK